MKQQCIQFSKEIVVKYLMILMLALFVGCDDDSGSDDFGSDDSNKDTEPKEDTYNGPPLDEYVLTHDFTFGKSGNITSIEELDAYFNPYGIAGTNVINQEWQRYQPFNSSNFVFTDSTLQLRALTDLGGIEDGGISSGQIVTEEGFYPSEGKTLLIQLRAKIPHGEGTWPAFWMYSPGGSGTTDSEIDIFEFFNSETQNTYDWTGFNHGSGVGDDYYSIMTNQWVWHPGFDFSEEYHVYTLIWKEGDVQKWVDKNLVLGTYFEWYGPDPVIIVNLAMGGKPNNPPNAQETPFPSIFSLDYLRIYEK